MEWKRVGFVRHFSFYQCPYGGYILVEEQGGLAEIRFAGERTVQELDHWNPETEEEPEVLCQTRLWLDGYFAGSPQTIKAIPLRLKGTAFQRLVWELLLEIPQGRLTTYGELAHRAAERMNKGSMSAQAIGQAVGRNPVPILVPCHRVVGKNGALVGYRDGLQVKRWLLRHEGFCVGREGLIL